MRFCPFGRWLECVSLSHLRLEGPAGQIKLDLYSTAALLTVVTSEFCLPQGELSSACAFHPQALMPRQAIKYCHAIPHPTLCVTEVSHAQQRQATRFLRPL